MKRIPLTQGKFALVDDKNYDYLNQWKWAYSSAGYAIRTEHLGPDPARKRKYLSRVILMHRVINRTPAGMYTDHVNGNRVDNQEANLRTCGQSQNIANHKINANNTSGYKGVIWDKRSRKWVAQIKVSYRQKYLGSSKSRVEAAKMYNAGATKYFGEFAKLNKISGD